MVEAEKGKLKALSMLCNMFRRYDASASIFSFLVCLSFPCLKHFTVNI